MISRGKFLSKKNITRPKINGEGSTKNAIIPRIILAEKAR